LEVRKLFAALSLKPCSSSVRSCFGVLCMSCFSFMFMFGLVY